MKQNLTIDEACDYIGLRRTKIYALIGENRLYKFKIDGRTLITVASADALIESSKEISNSQ